MQVMSKISTSVVPEYSENHVAERTFISEIEAQKIANWFTKNFEWIEKSTVSLLTSRKRLLGKIYPLSGQINLYGSSRGATAGTLLHELAHYKHANHSFAFITCYKELLQWWDEFSDEIIAPPAPRFVGKIEDVIEYLVDEASEGELMTKYRIGMELKEEGLNKGNAINVVMQALANAGYPVTR